MDLKFFCPYWGMNKSLLDATLKQIKTSGYTGVELALNPDIQNVHQIKQIFDDNGLEFLVQMPYAMGDTPTEMLTDYFKKLEILLALNPVMINSHTGRDYFTFEQNLEFIKGADTLSKAYGITIAHETHRGRFSFAAMITEKYIEAFPDMKITADFSHWCVVSESLLENQQHIIDKVIPNCVYIHARVGYAQGPQVPNPAAPEYQNELKQHTKWWQQIINHQRQTHKKEFIITPEFGPAPYMHTLPFTNELVASQYDLNLFMKNYLSKNLI